MIFSHFFKQVSGLLIFLSLPVTTAANITNPPIATLSAILDLSSRDPIILVDNDHESEGLRRVLAERLVDIKQADPRLDCLFVETDRRIQPAIDSFYANSNENFDLVREAYRKVTGFRRYRESDEIRFALTEELLVSARSLGIYIFAADLDFSTALGRKSQSLQKNASFSSASKLERAIAETLLSERNKSIAALLARNFQKCQRSMIYIGRLHTVSSFEGFSVTSLQRALQEELGLRVRMGSLEEFNCETAHSPVRKKLSCLKMSGVKSYIDQQNGAESTPHIEFTLTGEP